GRFRRGGGEGLIRGGVCRLDKGFVVAGQFEGAVGGGAAVGGAGGGWGRGLGGVGGGGAAGDPAHVVKGGVVDELQARPLRRQIEARRHGLQDEALGEVFRGSHGRTSGGSDPPGAGASGGVAEKA